MAIEYYQIDTRLETLTRVLGDNLQILELLGGWQIESTSLIYTVFFFLNFKVKISL